MIEFDFTVAEETFTLAVRATLEASSVAILGASGSGKTTMLEAIAGLRRARGRIALFGETLLGPHVDLPPEERRIGWVPQEVALFPHLDVKDNVAFGVRRGDAEARRRMDEAIEVLALESLLSRPTKSLSGGERQRVALARALATGPRLLLLDEPFAAVDVEHRARILPWLLRVREATRVPLLHVTHDIGEALAVATHAIVLRAGKVVSAGRLDAAWGALGDVPELAIDNVLVGVVGEGSLRVSDLAHLKMRVMVPRGGADGPATYVLPAHEIILAARKPEAISARNVWLGRVRRIDVVGEDAVVHVDALGTTLRAKLTREAVSELALADGVEAWLIVKTHALRRVS